MLEYRKGLKSKARRFRSNMTDAEATMWEKLRRKQLAGIQFYRQKPIGDYIVDFYAPRARLVVELDGWHHAREVGRKRDDERTSFLEEHGLTVLRFDDRQALTETDGVLSVILEYLLKFKA